MKKSKGHAKRKMAIKKNRHSQPEPEEKRDVKVIKKKIKSRSKKNTGEEL